MSFRTEVAALGAVGLVLCVTGSASAQFGNGGGFGGGFGQGGGFGGQGGSQALQTGLPQQLPPPILRTNWYMYNSVGGMGTTGGTITVPTQFGLQAQFGNSLGGGVAGLPGARVNPFGVNYQRQVNAMLAYQYALAYQNALAQANMGTPAPASNSSRASMAASYGGLSSSASPSLGFSRMTQLDSVFNTASFDPKDSKDQID